MRAGSRWRGIVCALTSLTRSLPNAREGGRASIAGFDMLLCVCI